MKTTITHLTSAHPRYDVRIFVKMCQSLAQIPHYEVSLIVADGLGDEMYCARSLCQKPTDTPKNLIFSKKSQKTKNASHVEQTKIKIYDIGTQNSRLKRMLKVPAKIYHKALELDSDIYHLHDPELLSVARKLKQKGKIVIFDWHEDVPKQIMDKPYIPRILRPLISKIWAKYELHVSQNLDYIITATPKIAQKFQKQNISTCKDVNNYPILSEFLPRPTYQKEQNNICYIGAITATRGAYEMIEAIKLVPNATLHLAGNIEPKIQKLIKDVKNIKYHGLLTRKEVAKLLSTCKASLVTLHSTPAYKEALPIKMFEYMASALPIIASDFPLWRTLTSGANCALHVDPQDPQAIANAIQKLLNDPVTCNQMSQNALAQAQQKFNWQTEREKLLNIYENLINQNPQI